MVRRARHQKVLTFAQPFNDNHSSQCMTGPKNAPPLNSEKFAARQKLI